MRCPGELSRYIDETVTCPISRVSIWSLLRSEDPACNTAASQIPRVDSSARPARARATVTPVFVRKLRLLAHRAKDVFFGKPRSPAFGHAYIVVIRGSMSSEIMHQILETIEAEVQSRPSAIEFEMAYQARVAIDRIRFAIKHTEQFGPRSDPIREAGLQLLDALQRLETVDRRFQERSRARAVSGLGGRGAREAANGHRARASDGTTGVNS